MTVQADLIDETCQYCFGAKELTKDGKLFKPCPLCNGGELTPKEVKKANRKLKLYTKFINDY